MAHGRYIATTDILAASRVTMTTGGRLILNNASIQVSRGSVTGLLGANGSGMSALLQCVTGIYKTSICDVHVNGVRIASPYTIPGLINYLPQLPFLPCGITMRRALQQYGISPAALFTHFPEMEDYLITPVGQLSTGAERLLSALIVLMARTRFSLLDAPFTHIMPLYTNRLAALLHRQKQEKGIIVTGHNYPNIFDLCDTVYLLHDGTTTVVHSTAQLEEYGFHPGNASLASAC